MNYTRLIYNQILENVGKKPILILFGARQVGKTTLTKSIMKNFKKPLYLQGDDPKDSSLLEGRSSTELKQVFSGHDLIVIDEAQRVKNIGIVLKLIADNIPDVKVIATGSSSFELANKLSEPLTGRNRKFLLYPLSIPELVSAHSKIEISRKIEEYFIFGMYPQIIHTEGREEKIRLIKELTNDYLFKDLFLFGDIRNSFAFEKLVKLLALHIGNEISYTQLAKDVGVSRETIYNYITLLERAFIVFRITPLYTNKIKEVNKSHKIYFYDTGIRNALVGNFDSFDLRIDKGAVFENFFIAEKMKEREYANRSTEVHFWKNRSGAEIDFIEMSPDRTHICAYECKWKDKASVPAGFKTLYPQATFDTVTSNDIVEHFLDIV
jgi:uncharacterized protein